MLCLRESLDTFQNLYSFYPISNIQANVTENIYKTIKVLNDDKIYSDTFQNLYLFDPISYIQANNIENMYKTTRVLSDDKIYSDTF